tara:strand:+ start:69 stop:710 length:642 start_codon:yes stop_codon:yes gene_type:complete
MKIFIPAREGSKGLPYKNRKLLGHTLSMIPDSYKSSVIISTNDQKIYDRAILDGFNAVWREDSLSQDEVSIKQVLSSLIKNENISCKETVIMLYLTYPERKWEEVEKILAFYLEHGATSLLCKKEIKSHPYLCMVESGDGKHGTQLVSHNLYRRQDYPICFEISHYVSIFQANEVQNLNDNLYNEKTFFYKIEDKIDVDLPKDLEFYYDKHYC